MRNTFNIIMLAISLLTFGAPASADVMNYTYIFDQGFFQAEFNGSGCWSQMIGYSDSTSAWTSGFFSVGNVMDPDTRQLTVSAAATVVSEEDGYWSFTANSGGDATAISNGPIGHGSVVWEALLLISVNGQALYSVPAFDSVMAQNGAGLTERFGMGSFTFSGDLIAGNEYAFELITSASAACLFGSASFVGGFNTDLRVNELQVPLLLTSSVVPEPGALTVAAAVAGLILSRRPRALVG